MRGTVGHKFNMCSRRLAERSGSRARLFGVYIKARTWTLAKRWYLAGSALKDDRYSKARERSRDMISRSEKPHTCQGLLQRAKIKVYCCTERATASLELDIQRNKPM